MCDNELRKKKRQILEEDESMGEEDFRKEAEGHDTMPSNMDLPEDTTGRAPLFVFYIVSVRGGSCQTLRF